MDSALSNSLRAITHGPRDNGLGSFLISVTFDLDIYTLIVYIHGLTDHLGHWPIAVLCIFRLTKSFVFYYFAIYMLIVDKV
jgi:hypothetical protein